MPNFLRQLYRDIQPRSCNHHRAVLGYDGLVKLTDPRQSTPGSYPRVATRVAMIRSNSRWATRRHDDGVRASNTSSSLDDRAGSQRPAPLPKRRVLPGCRLPNHQGIALRGIHNIQEASRVSTRPRVPSLTLNNTPLASKEMRTRHDRIECNCQQSSEGALMICLNNFYEPCHHHQRQCSPRRGRLG